MSRSILVKLREVRRRDGRIARIALAFTEVLYTGALSVLKSENGPEMTVPPISGCDHSPRWICVQFDADCWDDRLPAPALIPQNLARICGIFISLQT